MNFIKMGKYQRNLVEFFRFFKSIFFFFLYRNDFKGKVTVAFSMNNPVYSSFYYPIYQILLKCNNYNLICFGHSVFGLPNFSKFFQILFPYPLIILCADKDRFYVKKKHHSRIQIFHAIAQFGSSWDEHFLRRYDAVFVISKHMMAQLQGEPPYSTIVKQQSIKLYEVGYPKLDSLHLPKNCKVKKQKSIIFYGPTWHIKFSSIFSWLQPVIDEAKDNNSFLYIKLHPFLLDIKNDMASGGIDWISKIHTMCQESGIGYSIVPQEISNQEQKNIFRITDLFITDTSGIGFEFVLATGKPIIFLGNVIKTPIGKNPNNYIHHQQFVARGQIGPIVSLPSELPQVVNQLLITNKYQTAINEFRKSFVYNLGNASIAACHAIEEEAKKITVNTSVCE